MTSTILIIGNSFSGAPLFWKNFINDMAKGEEQFPYQDYEYRLARINDRLKNEFNARYEYPDPHPARILFTSQNDATWFVLKFS